MRLLNNDEIREFQLKILDNVVEFCNENNIKYWLDCGTMLGAVRHHGFIPWDDDIDIGMLRTDYDKFIHSFNKNKKGRYVLDCVEVNSNCRFPYAKVFDKETVLLERNIKLSINIDVFVYDNAPENGVKLRWMYFKRDVFNHLNAWQWGNGVITKNIIKRLIKAVISPSLKFFPRNFFCKLIIKNAKKYGNSDTKYIGHFTSITKVLMEKDFVESFVKQPFEGKMYNIPMYYDEWLKRFYGDYMKLPPKEERVGKHDIKAYLK